MSEHKKLLRMMARAFYRTKHASERITYTGATKFDDPAIIEVLVDSLTRRAWTREDDLASELRLSAKQVRKVLRFLEAERLLTRAHTKERDRDREARNAAKGLVDMPDQKRTVTFCALDYSRAQDVLKWRLHIMRAELKKRTGKTAAEERYVCTRRGCEKSYSSLDAASLLDPTTMSFICHVCAGEVAPATNEGVQILENNTSGGAGGEKMLSRARWMIITERALDACNVVR